MGKNAVEKPDVGLQTCGGDPAKRASLALSVYLTNPLRGDPENLTGFWLAWNLCYTWAKHFDQKASLSASPRQDYITHVNSGYWAANPTVARLQSPLQRMSTSISLQWMYD